MVCESGYDDELSSSFRSASLPTVLQATKQSGGNRTCASVLNLAFRRCHFRRESRRNDDN